MVILPKTKLGIWSVILAVALPALLILGGVFANSLYASVPAGNGLFDDLAKRPALAIVSLTGICAGLAAFVTGLVAISKHQERALLVYLSTLIGTLLIVMLVAQVFFPNP
jgi:hypothetical protein